MGDTGEAPSTGAVFRPLRSLRVWLLAAAVLALVAVATGAVTTFVTREQVDSSTRELNGRLQPAQSASQRLITAYVDEETGQRGFVLTGENAFLAPYRDGKRKADQLSAELEDELHGQADALLLLTEVKTAGSQWRDHASAQIQRVRADGVESAHRVANQQRDKVLFDRLRSRLDDLRAEVDRLVSVEVAQRTVAQRKVDRAMVVALVLAAVALVSTVALLRFALTRPLRRLHDQLSAVSGGDYGRHIDASGPEEVRQIAEAAESMRVSIVDRSAELVAAQHELGVHAERQRVAADLHDTTIQRIFGLGLKLSAVASQRSDLAGTLNGLIDEADEIIRELRQMIFRMNDEARAEPGVDERTRADAPGPGT